MKSYKSCNFEKLESFQLFQNLRKSFFSNFYLLFFAEKWLKCGNAGGISPNFELFSKKVRFATWWLKIGLPNTLRLYYLKIATAPANELQSF